MSQNSLVLPTSGTLSGLQAVTDINGALDTLNTKWSGAGAPATAEFGQTWLDTSTTPATLRLYDGAQWVAVGTLDGANHVWQPALAPVTSLAANTALTAADVSRTFASGAANITVTLPQLSSVPDGAEFGFQCQNPILTVAASGSEKLYGPNWWGVSSIALNHAGAAVRVKKESNTGWLLLAHQFPFAAPLDVQSGTDGQLIMTPAAWAGYAFGASAQSWQNVTPSRAPNTTYTNSTGRPIGVALNCGVNGAVLIVNGVQVATFGSAVATAFTVVPAAGTYSLNAAFGFWSEYR